MSTARILSMPTHARLPRILVRNLKPDEQIPFKHGCEYLSLDPRWVWAAIDKSRICGILIGANVHGMFFISRMVLTKDAPKNTALVLLRQVRKSVSARGLTLWTTFLMPAPERPSEEKLTRLAARFGAQVLPACGAWVIGRV